MNRRQSCEGGQDELRSDSGAGTDGSSSTRQPAGHREVTYVYPPVPDVIHVRVIGTAADSGAYSDRTTPTRQVAVRHAPAVIRVGDAGIVAVNGFYSYDGELDGAYMYSMFGEWHCQQLKLFVLQCLLSNGTRQWYISAVSPTGIAGTSADIDFYCAPASSNGSKCPPQIGWLSSLHGVDPPPKISYIGW